MNKEELYIDRLEKAIVRATIALLKIHDEKHSYVMMRSYTLKAIHDLEHVVEKNV
jgi:hypothetical protein